MNGILIFLYGLYITGVGVNGNESLLYADIKEEKGFVPWLVSALILAVLAQNKHTEKLVAPLAGLLVLTFAVKNIDTIKTEFSGTWAFLKGSTASTSSTTSSQKVA